MTTSDKSQFNKGVKEALDVVGSTMGPSGRTVMEGGGKHRLVRDGFTVLNMLSSLEVLENEAFLRIQDMAKNLVSAAGDGTSTGTLILGNTYLAYEAAIAAGEISRQRAIQEVDAAKEAIIAEIKKQVIPVSVDGGVNEDLVLKVATIAAAGDEKVGKAIAEMMLKVGPDSDIRVEASDDLDVHTRTIHGFSFDGRVLDRTQYNSRNQLTLDDASVFVLSDEVNDFAKQVNVPYDAHLRKYGVDKPFLIFALSADGTAKATMLNPAVNDGRGGTMRARMWFIQVATDETLRDIAAVSGAKLFNPRAGQMLKHFKPEDLGSISGLTATTSSCTILPDKENSMDILAYCEGLDDEARSAAIQGNVGVVSVPVKTLSMGTFYYELIDDAWRATRSAMKNGVVPGCGYTLAIAAEGMPEPIQEGLRSVHRTVCLNADYHPSDTFERGNSFNVSNGLVGDAVELGVLDAAESLTAAVQYAFTELAIWLNTKYLLWQSK